VSYETGKALGRVFGIRSKLTSAPIDVALSLAIGLRQPAERDFSAVRKQSPDNPDRAQCFRQTLEFSQRSVQRRISSSSRKGGYAGATWRTSLAETPSVGLESIETQPNLKLRACPNVSGRS
jgi:hypothetical protein